LLRELTHERGAALGELQLERIEPLPRRGGEPCFPGRRQYLIEPGGSRRPIF
jgi:hypothetical protein